MKYYFTLLLVSVFFANAKAQTFSWSGNMSILDMQTIYVPITVSGLPSVIDSSFGLAHICMDIYHTYDADIVVKLIAPNGDSVTLIQGIGGGGDHFLGTCVGVDGTFFNNSTAPYSGIFQPIGNTFALNNGQNPNGIWQLMIRDVANADTGNIVNAGIVFVNNPPQPGGGTIGGGPTGLYLCPTCVCPAGASGCDLLPDMTSSYKEIDLNHNEVPGALYISNATPNIGFGPLEIYSVDSCFCDSIPAPCGVPCPAGQEKQNIIRQRVYKKIPGNDTLSYFDNTAGMMTYHDNHGHLHVDNFVNYTLRTPTANPDATTWPIIATGSKQSFCLINLGTCPGNVGECRDEFNNIITTLPNQNLGFHTGCGVNQGIYVGNYDVYSISLNDPIILDNVCNGNYYIVSITDPDNNFLESNENNNWVAVPITLTQQNGVMNINPSGSTTFCAGDSVILTASLASNYLWSTGDTTQSITVYNSGNYFVSSNCGANTTTSAIVSVTVLPNNAAPSVSIAITAGANPACLATSITFTATATNGGTSAIFQWKVNGVNVGTNTNVYTTNTLTNGQVVTCELTSSLLCLTTQMATSNAITISVTNTLCYCIPVYGTTANSGCLDGDVIARVTLNTLDNNSGTGCPSGIAGYTDYYSSTNPLHSTSLQAGNSYSCVVFAGQYGEGYKVWIDFNDDGIFSTNEVVGNTTAIVPGSGSAGVLGSSAKFQVIIPCNIPTGNHRMRVRCIYSNNGISIDPCIYQNNFGEAEDYKITILPPNGCSAPNTQSVANITSTSATLAWIPGCVETSWNVHVTTLGGGIPNGTPSNPNVTYPLIKNGLLPSTNYEYWVSSVCNGGATSTWTGPFPFTTAIICSNVPGTSQANPIVIGNLPCVTFPYMNTKTNTLANCFINNYSGANNQAAPDVWYQFTLPVASNVQISHCNSNFDTYLHLLNNAGTQVLFNDDNGPLCNTTASSIQANNLAAGTYFVVSEGYGANTGLITTKINKSDTCSFTTLQLNCFIEGYWNGQNEMVAALSNQGISSLPTNCDSIEVSLHQTISPFAKVATTKTILDIHGSASCYFSNIIPTSYYVSVKHRNSIETWSANPILVNTNPVNYYFNTASNKAYGNNQVEVESGVWALFSGDITQDGSIEVGDYSIWEADANNFESGYRSADLNGDGAVDISDYSFWEANANNFVGVVKP